MLERDLDVRPALRYVSGTTGMLERDVDVRPVSRYRYRSRRRPRPPE